MTTTDMHYCEQIAVNLYYDDAVIERNEEYLQMDGLELTAELGGFMGLFLGLSFYQILATGIKMARPK